jgi:hypothetical protein
VGQVAKMNKLLVLLGMVFYLPHVKRSYDLPDQTRDPEFVLKIKGDPNPTNLSL